MKIKTLLEEFQEEPTKLHSTIIDNKIDDIIDWINDFEDAMENDKIDVVFGNHGNYKVKRNKDKVAICLEKMLNIRAKKLKE